MNGYGAPTINHPFSDGVTPPDDKGRITFVETGPANVYALNANRVDKLAEVKQVVPPQKS